MSLDLWRWRHGAWFALVCGCLLLACLPLCAAERIYHVDAVHGADTQDGLTPATAWRSLPKVNSQTYGPGDQLLFHAGHTWDGQLRPQGSGSPGKPIRLGRYGDGALPVIHQGTRAGAVLELVNQDQWEIADLELAGGAGTVVGGIHVTGTTAGRILSHLVIRGCVVRDTQGSPRSYASSAIWVGVPGWNNAQGLTTGFDDVVIENNTISRANRCGILVWTCAGPGDHSQFQAGLIPSTRVVVRGNQLQDIGGDGILILGSRGPLIERNVVRRAGISVGNPTDGPTTNGYNALAATIWLHHCSQGLMQRNAVYDTVALKYNSDGEAFDFDYNCFDCILQDNYSRNNAGGFLICMESAKRNIARFNISEDDGGHLVYLLGGMATENWVHNNTFWSTKNGVYLHASGYLFNNLFINAGPGKWTANTSQGAWFSNNCYAGSWAKPNDANGITADPALVAPGKAGNSMDNLAVYRLRQGSPCLGAGYANNAVVNGRTITIPRPATQDLFGMPVRIPSDLGACQRSLPTIAAALPAGGAVAGGTVVTISGTNLTGTTVVTFGGVPATNVTVLSDTSVRCTIPAHPAGAVDLILSTPCGTTSATRAFTYLATVSVPAPTLDAISPNRGSATGGTTVTITGTGLTTATAVTFGGAVAPTMSVVDGTTLICTTPARTLGVVDVAVITPSGTAYQREAFTYVLDQEGQPVATPPNGADGGGSSGCGNGGALAIHLPLLLVLVHLHLRRPSRMTHPAN